MEDAGGKLVLESVLNYWSVGTKIILNAYATMHTAGQAFMMALQEVVPMHSIEVWRLWLMLYRTNYTAKADFIGTLTEQAPNAYPPFLSSHSSWNWIGHLLWNLPTWNAYPSILASLCTGNPVVVKPIPMDSTNGHCGSNTRNYSKNKVLIPIW